MARLSANGSEVARFERTALTPNSDLTVKERTTRSIRSNGWILSKRDVWFRPGPFDHGKVERHAGSWKRWRKIKKGVDPKRALETLQPILEKHDWVRVQEGGRYNA